jgi:hypothetical protein
MLHATINAIDVLHHVIVTVLHFLVQPNGSENNGG